MYMTVVEENIRRILNEKGLKHKVVAVRAGLTPQQFSDMLNGRRNIYDIDVLHISMALEVTPNELLGFKIERGWG